MPAKIVAGKKVEDEDVWLRSPPMTIFAPLWLCVGHEMLDLFEGFQVDDVIKRDRDIVDLASDYLFIDMFLGVRNELIIYARLNIDTIG